MLRSYVQWLGKMWFKLTVLSWIKRACFAGHVEVKPDISKSDADDCSDKTETSKSSNQDVMHLFSDFLFTTCPEHFLQVTAF